MSSSRYSISYTQDRLFRAIESDKYQMGLIPQRFRGADQIYVPWAGKRGLDRKADPAAEVVRDSAQGFPTRRDCRCGRIRRIQASGDCIRIQQPVAYLKTESLSDSGLAGSVRTCNHGKNRRHVLGGVRLQFADNRVVFSRRSAGNPANLKSPSVRTLHHFQAFAIHIENREPSRERFVERCAGRCPHGLVERSVAVIVFVRHAYIITRCGTSNHSLASNIPPAMKQIFVVPALYSCVALGLGQDDALAPYRKQLEANPRSSLAHYRIAEIFMSQKNYQSAANEFREALNGDLEPPWIERQSRLSLGAIFDMTGQFERALNEYQQANRSSARDAPVVAEPVQRKEPEYSEEGRVAGLEGVVLLAAVIAEDGSARDMRVTQPLGLGLDEKAIEAVKEWRFKERPVPAPATIAVDFRLPSKQSRWHLIRASFSQLEGASRPVFQSAKYPSGAGVSRTTIEEARIVAAVGRLATATLLFDVDEKGRPVDIWVQSASEAVWGNAGTRLALQARHERWDSCGCSLYAGACLGLEEFVGFDVSQTERSYSPAAASSAGCVSSTSAGSAADPSRREYSGLTINSDRSARISAARKAGSHPGCGSLLRADRARRTRPGSAPD